MSSSQLIKKQKEMNALKQQAMKYYEENKVPIQMEAALNSLFYEQPQDVYGYLIDYFKQFSKPSTITKLSAMLVLDSNGLFTIQTDVYCTSNNVQKLISSSIVPRANIRLNLEDREKAEMLIQASIEAAINIINSELNSRLAGMDPSLQELIDSEIMTFLNLQKEKEEVKKVPEVESSDKSVSEKTKKSSPKTKGSKLSTPQIITPDRNVESFVVGCEAVAAVSQAVCACGAISRHIPIYQHIAKLDKPTGPGNVFRIPIPMVTIIQSGKSVSGKVTCVNEFMIMPGPDMQIDKAVKYIQQIYQYISKSLMKKLGPLAKLVNEVGALCPQLDTVNQALDMLLEAISAQNLTVGQDIYLAISGSAHECFDYV